MLLNKCYRINVIAEISAREAMTKTLSKYVSSFDYFDKILLVLSATSGSVLIASFVNDMVDQLE